jgi:hypothetical protein
VRKNLPIFMIGIGLAVAAIPVAAHHSFAAEFDGTKAVRLEGKLTKIQWTNPHSYFYIDVADSKGNLVNWGCEGGAPGALSRRGFKRGDIKEGDTLIVDGYLAKDGSHLIDARRVTLPDGRIVSGGSAGDGGPGSEDTKQK